MSVVTNIILTFSSSEDQKDIESHLQEFRYNGNMKFNIVSIEDPSVGRDWYGGTKYMECSVYIGAYNHLDIKEFLSHLKKIPWYAPDDVRLFIKSQDDFAFELVRW